MKRKLNSECGVALAFVIVAFAVVMVLGTVGITAGYANYSKSFGRLESRQAYLTLISAARLLKEELNGAEIVVLQKEIHPDDGEPYKLEPEISYDPDTGLAAQLLRQFAADYGRLNAIITVQKADYSENVTLNMGDTEGLHDLLAENEEKQSIAMTLTSKGRTVSVETYFARSDLTEEPVITGDGVCYTSKTTYTLNIGAIHEEASR